MWGSLADFTGAQAIALISQRPLSVAKLSSVLKTVRLLLAPTATSSVVAGDVCFQAVAKLTSTADMRSIAASRSRS